MDRLAVPVQLVGLGFGDAWAASVWGRSGALGFAFVALLLVGFAFGAEPHTTPVPPIVDPEGQQQPAPSGGTLRRLLSRWRKPPSPAEDHIRPRAEGDLWTS